MNNDTQFFIETKEDEMKALIGEMYPRYEASVNHFRRICEENKETLERYFRENPEKQDKELKICEFL
jgi:hypothetical protein